jgi:CubicO group peptidase (beta-lactamase class C family)
MLFSVSFLWVLTLKLQAQDAEISKKLKDFDPFVEKMLKEWNVPGCAVAIVKDQKIVFSKGYGFADLQSKRKMTPQTLFNIASCTKAFTSAGVGKLVETGKVAWDKPAKNYIPDFQLFNQTLTDQVSPRDLLAHRTGISRHDNIWYESDLSRQEIVQRAKYLEPSLDFRAGYLYNNIMFLTAGYLIESQANMKYEDFIRQEIFTPLEMTNSGFLGEKITQKPEMAQAYMDLFPTDDIMPVSIYQGNSIGPEGGIVSNVLDLSNWVTMQLNQGKYKGKEIFQASTLAETHKPSNITATSAHLEYDELGYPMYGMGWRINLYRGHLMVGHNGNLKGFSATVNLLPKAGWGMVILVNKGYSDFNTILYYNIADRILGLKPVDWHSRFKPLFIKAQESALKARQNKGIEPTPNTKPSHQLVDYTGVFEHEAYPKVKIWEEKGELWMQYNSLKAPLKHYHYDVFESMEDKLWGKFICNFYSNPQGEIDRLVIPIDEGEVIFQRGIDTQLSKNETLKEYVGNYSDGSSSLKIKFEDENTLVAEFSGAPPYHLLPFKPSVFKLAEFSDVRLEFVRDNDGKIKALKWKDGNGVSEFKR